jgi:hypothetical protein
MRFLLQSERTSSFLLIALLFLSTLAIQACVPIYTGVPAIDAANVALGAIPVIASSSEYGTGEKCSLSYDDFIETKKSNGKLRKEESVLLKNIWSEPNDGFLIITNERAIAYHHMYQCRIYELVMVERAEKIHCQLGCIGIKLYGTPSSNTPYGLITLNKDNDEIIDIINEQVELYDSIRSELGIVVPEDIYPPNLERELKRLNKDVIAEARSRRKNIGQ